MCPPYLLFLLSPSSGGDKEEANLLFQVISTRYKKGSIVITSNKSIVDWGEYLADSVLASALLDRLLHHSCVINIKGKSFGIKNKLKAEEKVSEEQI